MNKETEKQSEYEVSELTVDIANSDGSQTHYKTLLPKCIADKILVEVMEWKGKYFTTFQGLERYQASVKEFQERATQ